MKKYYIGVDIGTTSMKAALYNRELQLVDKSQRVYHQENQTEPMTSQKPEEIITLFDELISELIVSRENEIESISLSCAMHSILLVDHEGHFLSDLILWSDVRATEVIDEYKKREDWQNLYHRSGTPVHPMSPFAKLLWFKQNDMKTYQKIDRIYDLKSWIMDHYTGQYVLDYSLASATGLFNLDKLDWDQKTLDYLSLDKRKLPELVDVTAEYKMKNKAILLHIGASDGCLANYGSQIENEESPLLTMGTSGALRIISDRKAFNPVVQSFCYYMTADQWVMGAAVNNCGNVLQWLAKLLYRTTDVSAIIENIRSENNSGMYFLPYLFGERAPYWDGSLLASFHGISKNTTDKDLIQAAMEGVLFNLYQIYHELYPKNKQGLKVTGALFDNKEIAQMTANIFGCEVIILKNNESGCFGAVTLRLTHYTHKTYYAQEDYRIYPDCKRNLYYQSVYTKWKALADKYITSLEGC